MPRHSNSESPLVPLFHASLFSFLNITFLFQASFPNKLGPMVAGSSVLTDVELLNIRENFSPPPQVRKSQGRTLVPVCFVLPDYAWEQGFGGTENSDLVVQESHVCLKLAVNLGTMAML